MTKKQFFLVFFSGLLFLFLYFGTNVRASRQENIDVKRNLAAVGLSVAPFLKDAKSEILASELAFIELQEQKLTRVVSDSQRISIYEILSSAWYELKKPLISGFYAEEMAKIVSDEKAWSIAGTIFLLAVQNGDSDLKRTFGVNHAVKDFENAISINPENLSHRINLALCYVEKAPLNEPMKGILMLLDLNEKYPENIPTLLALGKLGMKSNQWEKAIGRFEKILTIEPTNNQAICFLALVYEKTGNTNKYNEFSNRCQR